MVPPLPQRQKLTLVTKLSESYHAPSTQTLPLCKSYGDQDVEQAKASADQNIHQHQQATSKVAKMFMVAIILTKTPRSLLSNDISSMVEGA